MPKQKCILYDIIKKQISISNECPNIGYVNLLIDISSIDMYNANNTIRLVTMGQNLTILTTHHMAMDLCHHQSLVFLEESRHR